MQSLFRVKDTAPMLKISVVKLRRLIKQNEIPYHKIGKIFVFTEDDISTYLSNVSVPMKEAVKS